MRIATASGRSPRLIRAELDAADLAEFEAFYVIEPWGCLPDDYRAGLIATCAANANPMRKYAAKLDDMIPKRAMYIEDMPESQSEEEIIAILTSVFGEPKHG